MCKLVRLHGTTLACTVPPQCAVLPAACVNDWALIYNDSLGKISTARSSETTQNIACGVPCTIVASPNKAEIHTQRAKHCTMMRRLCRAIGHVCLYCILNKTACFPRCACCSNFNYRHVRRAQKGRAIFRVIFRVPRLVTVELHYRHVSRGLITITVSANVHASSSSSIIDGLMYFG